MGFFPVTIAVFEDTMNLGPDLVGLSYFPKKVTKAKKPGYSISEYMSYLVRRSSLPTDTGI